MVAVAPPLIGARENIGLRVAQAAAAAAKAHSYLGRAERTSRRLMGARSGGGRRDWQRALGAHSQRDLALRARP